MNLINKLIILCVFFLLSSQPILSLLDLNPFVLFILIFFVLICANLKNIPRELLTVDSSYIILCLVLLLFSAAVNGLTGPTIVLAFQLAVLVAARYILNNLFLIPEFMNLLMLISIVIALGSSYALASHYFFGLKPQFALVDLLNLRNYYWLNFSFSPSDGDLSMTNSYRPSGIYDEPGALAYSFVILSVLRLVRTGTMLTVFVTSLFVSFVSGSLFGVYATIPSLFASIASLKSNKSFLTTLAVVIIVLALFASPKLNYYFNSELFSRLAGVGGQPLFGSRQESIESSVDFLIRFDFDLILKGDRSGNTQNTGGDFLSILVGYGLFPWFFYLAILWRLAWISFASIFIAPFQSNYISVAATMLLIALLQRPYIFHVYWAIPTMAAFLALNQYAFKPSRKSL